MAKDNELIIYTSEDGSISLNTRLEDESIWLTQEMLALLLQASKKTISEHIINIIKEGELQES
jgi:hypothetical protein